MAINSIVSHRHRTPMAVPSTVNQGPIAPLKKTGTLKTVASIAGAVVGVARVLGGIYLFALYRQTVGRITSRKK